MSNIVIISGSPSKLTRLKGITDYAEHYLKQEGHSVEHIYVSDIPAEDLIFANFNSNAVQSANDKVAKADAVIVASPVYKASFTGILKTYLDLIPQCGLENKVVLPLMLGGTISHLLAIDYSLKPVLSALGADHIVKGVYTIDTCVSRHEDGTVMIEQEVEDRLSASFDKVIDALKQTRTYA